MREFPDKMPDYPNIVSRFTDLKGLTNEGVEIAGLVESIYEAGLKGEPYHQEVEALIEIIEDEGIKIVEEHIST